MPDFSDPKYASYVQLCRETLTPVKRHDAGWEMDDWCLGLRDDGQPELWYRAFGSELDNSEEIYNVMLTPIPTLADWREKLEEAGIPMIGLQVSEDGLRFAVFRLEVISVVKHEMTSAEVGKGPTPEEAAARLWQALQAETLARTAET